MTIRPTSDLRLSPYMTFSRREWAQLRAAVPLPLSEEDVRALRGLNEPISLDEVSAIYLPLARLLHMYVDATQSLYQVTDTFLGNPAPKVPYVIAIAGSVAAGKSTTARILRHLLARWPNHPKVDLVTTDGFLLPNATLRREGLMNRKGFPESYDLPSLLRFLSDIKAGRKGIAAPVYSHLTYDVVPEQSVVIDQPDILLVEGLNVLQTGHPPRDGEAIPYVSDFFDFSIYLDASEADLRRWYVDRFFSLRATAFRDPRSYFHKYASLTDPEAREIAAHIWETINLVNLRENVLPTRQRADLILHKGSDHLIDHVRLRKL